MSLSVLLCGRRGVRARGLVIPRPQVRRETFILIPLLRISSDVELPGVREPLVSVLRSVPSERKMQV